MGLDWHPEAKAVLGHEDELESIRAASISAEGHERELLLSRFQEITVPAWALLGAPIVGQDEAANLWLLDQVRAQHGLETPTNQPHLPQNEIERQALQEMSGYRVLQLLPDCDGFPVYTHAYLYEGPDRTSFRGQFLCDCIDIIGEPLLEKAYSRMGPVELISFGNSLLTHAREYSAKHGCQKLEDQKAPPEADPSHPHSNAHILFSAAKWCIFWGQRGHGLEPDF